MARSCSFNARGLVAGPDRDGGTSAVVQSRWDQGSAQGKGVPASACSQALAAVASIAVAKVSDAQRELIYDESVRALDEQAKVLEGLRTRVGILISAGAISTTFLGGQALHGSKSLTTDAWLAIAGFAVLSVCAIGVLFAKGGWVFTIDAKVLATRVSDKADWDSLPKMHTELAKANAGFWKANDDRLRRRHWAFNAACVALMGEVAFWLLALGGH